MHITRAIWKCSDFPKSLSGCVAWAARWPRQTPASHTNTPPALQQQMQRSIRFSKATPSIIIHFMLLWIDLDFVCPGGGSSDQKPCSWSVMKRATLTTDRTDRAVGSHQRWKKDDPRWWRRRLWLRMDTEFINLFSFVSYFWPIPWVPNCLPPPPRPLPLPHRIILFASTPKS